MLQFDRTQLLAPSLDFQDDFVTDFLIAIGDNRKKVLPFGGVPGRKSNPVVSVLGLSGSRVEELCGLEVAIFLRQITEVVE